MKTSPEAFSDWRYGMFIHYGLFSLLERAEWVWNREEIPASEYQALAGRFTAEAFDAEASAIWRCGPGCAMWF